MILQEPVDDWIIRGFSRIADLTIQRSNRGPMSVDQIMLLEASITNLQTVLARATTDVPDVNTDALMFSNLLQLSKILLARVQADKGFGRADLSLLRGYMATLETALARFHEHELCPSSTESVA